MEKYNYQKDLQESFYLSKRFKKIKQLVINDLSPLSKYQIFKIRLYTYKTNLYNKIFKHNKKLKLQYKERDLKLFNNLTDEELKNLNENIQFGYNTFITDYYDKYLKNDNTIFNISWKSFWYSILLMVIGKIISDPIICYNFICNLFND